MNEEEIKPTLQNWPGLIQLTPDISFISLRQILDECMGIRKHGSLLHLFFCWLVGCSFEAVNDVAVGHTETALNREADC